MYQLSVPFPTPTFTSSSASSVLIILILKLKAFIQDFEVCRKLHELLFRFGLAFSRSELGRWF